jgi:hypothetical protein
MRGGWARFFRNLTKFAPVLIGRVNIRRRSCRSTGFQIRRGIAAATYYGSSWSCQRRPLLRRVLHARRPPALCLRPLRLLLKGCVKKLISSNGSSCFYPSSPICKNISLHPSGKSSLQIRAIPPHHRGVSRSSRTRGADAVDAAAFCARRIAGRVDEACERSRSERTRDVAADGEVVWS